MNIDTTKVPIDLIYLFVSNLVALAFGAGGVYFLLKQSRRDVNGLGAKISRELSRSAVRHQNISLALMLLADQEQRDQIAALMKEAHEEKAQ